jgi:hypothetical protein
MDRAKHMAKVNQHPPVHNERWMVNGQETGFCRVPNSLANQIFVLDLLEFLRNHTQSNPYFVPC